MPTVAEMKARWNEIAGRLSKGATVRAKMEEEQRREEAEAAKKLPPPPDPNLVLLASWAQRDEQTFAALLNVIDGFIRFHSAERREAVSSHPFMAFHDGECASLEQLRKKLTDLRG